MPCLNLQLKKFQNYILYIRKKYSLQLKTNFTHKNLEDMFMYEKNPDTIFLLWQPSWMPYCIKALL